MAALETHLADRHRREGGLSKADYVSLACIAALAAVNVYRAWTQSITYDEAYAWENFLRGPIWRIFSTYHVNNHVLQSALSWLAIHWFGFREFSLRLPSVLGGVLYLASAWRLSRRLFGRGWFQTLAVLALSLNPFTLDFLSAARGYGLGVALMLWALLHLVFYFDGENQPVHLWKAGVGLGLAVTSTLVFLYPALALGGMVFLLLLADEPSARRLWLAVDNFAGPAVVAGFVLLVIPLTRVHMDFFYFGAPSLAMFSRTIVTPSLFHRGTPSVFSSWPGAFALAIVPGIIGLAVIAAGVAAVRLVRGRSLAALAPIDRFLLLVGGTLAALLAEVLVTHYWLRLPYPESRTGIYWALLVTLAALALAWKFLAAGRRLAAAPLLVVLCVAIGLFAAGFETTYYSEWAFDRSTRQIAGIIRSREHGARPGVSVGVTWLLEPSMNFYRRLYRMGWMRPVVRGSPDGAFDYYVLLPRDHALIAKRHLVPLYSDKLSGAVLAVPAGGTARVEIGHPLPLCL